MTTGSIWGCSLPLGLQRGLSLMSVPPSGARTTGTGKIGFKPNPHNNSTITMKASMSNGAVRCNFKISFQALRSLVPLPTHLRLRTRMMAAAAVHNRNLHQSNPCKSQPCTPGLPSQWIHDGCCRQVLETGSHRFVRICANK